MRDSKKYRRCLGCLCGVILILLLAGMGWGAVQDTLRPVSDEFTDTGHWPPFPIEGERWEKIDEAVSDDDDTYIHDNVDDHSYAFNNADWGGSGDPDSCAVCFNMRKAGAFNTFKAAIGRAMSSESIFAWCGAADTVQEDSETYTIFCKTFTTDPCTDAAWTTASLNSNSYGWGIRFAFDQTTQFGRCTQGYVVVYSTEAAGGSPRRRRMGGNFEEDYHNSRTCIPVLDR